MLYSKPKAMALVSFIQVMINTNTQFCLQNFRDHFCGKKWSLFSTSVKGWCDILVVFNLMKRNPFTFCSVGKHMLDSQQLVCEKQKSLHLRSFSTSPLFLVITFADMSQTSISSGEEENRNNSFMCGCDLPNCVQMTQGGEEVLKTRTNNNN